MNTINSQIIYTLEILEKLGRLPLQNICRGKSISLSRPNTTNRRNKQELIQAILENNRSQFLQRRDAAEKSRQLLKAPVEFYTYNALMLMSVKEIKLLCFTFHINLRKSGKMKRKHVMINEILEYYGREIDAL